MTNGNGRSGVGLACFLLDGTHLVRVFKAAETDYCFNFNMTTTINTVKRDSFNKSNRINEPICVGRPFDF